MGCHSVTPMTAGTQELHPTVRFVRASSDAKGMRQLVPGRVVEAASAYALWQELRLTEEALQLGDILELPGGQLRIFKYVGFEEAQWVVHEASMAVNEGTGTTDQLATVR